MLQQFSTSTNIQAFYFYGQLKVLAYRLTCLIRILSRSLGYSGLIAACYYIIKL